MTTVSPTMQSLIGVDSATTVMSWAAAVAPVIRSWIELTRDLSTCSPRIPDNFQSYMCPLGKIKEFSFPGAHGSISTMKIGAVISHTNLFYTFLMYLASSIELVITQRREQTLKLYNLSCICRLCITWIYFRKVGGWSYYIIFREEQ